jgi:ATP-dependent Clp protease ATP-binding subunit ClpA
VRQQVEEIIGQGQEAPAGHIPCTPRAKRILELSLRESLQLGHQYIGTEHILLGLIREGEGVAAQVLVRLGADLNRVRQQVIQLLHGPGGAEREGSAAAPRERGLPPEVAARLDTIDSRLSAVEQRAGTGPDTAELDQQIEQAQRDRDAAIDAQEYERAASLRDREKDLLAQKASHQQQWVATHPDLPSLADKLRQLSDEIDRLHALLREQGMEPKDGAA